MKNKIIVATLFVAGLCNFGQANAGTASAELSNFGWKLIDLDLSDGVSPYLNYIGGYTSSMTTNFNGQNHASNISFNGFLGDFNYSSSFGADGSRLVVDARSEEGTFNVSSVSNASGRQIDDYWVISSASSLLSTASPTSNFILAPNSRVVFTGDYSLLAQWGGPVSNASAGVSLSVSGAVRSPSGYTTQNYQQSISGTTIYTSAYWADPNPSFSGSLFAAYTNNTSIAQEFGMNLSVYTSTSAGLTYISPIPEPANLVLMLAGLVPLYISASRRKING